LVKLTKIQAPITILKSQLIVILKKEFYQVCGFVNWKNSVGGAVFIV
jgi:hypothetical protein